MFILTQSTKMVGKVMLCSLFFSSITNNHSYNNEFNNNNNNNKNNNSVGLVGATSINIDNTNIFDIDVESKLKPSEQLLNHRPSSLTNQKLKIQIDTTMYKSNQYTCLISKNLEQETGLEQYEYETEDNNNNNNHLTRYACIFVLWMFCFMYACMHVIYVLCMYACNICLMYVCMYIGVSHSFDLSLFIIYIYTLSRIEQLEPCGSSFFCNSSIGSILMTMLKLS